MVATDEMECVRHCGILYHKVVVTAEVDVLVEEVDGELAGGGGMHPGGGM